MRRALGLLGIAGLLSWAGPARADSCTLPAFTPVPLTAGEAGKDAAVWAMHNAWHRGLIVALVDENTGEKKVEYYHTSAEPLPDSSTAYRIGSVTKTFTATLLELFASRGQVNVPTCPGNPHPSTLSSLVQDLLSNVNSGPCTLPSARDAMTLEELATHSSGLPRTPPRPVCTPADVYAAACTCQLDATNGSYTDTCAPARCPDQSPCVVGNYSCNTNCGYSANDCPLQAPGVSVIYSNFGYSLLGHLLVHLTPGNPGTWWSANQTQILTPLGMTHTFTDDQGTLAGVTKASSYEGCVAGSGTCTLSTTPYASVENPAGGLWQTGPDMLKWLEYNMQIPPDGGLTPSQSELYDLVPELRCARKGTATLGYFRDNLDGHTVITKDGSWNSFHSWMGYLPDRGIGVFVVSNSNDGGDSATCGKISDVAKAILHNMP